LRPLKELSSLHLNGNQITRIQSTDFEGLTKLRVLSLSTCGIREVEPFTFVGMSLLESLILSKNQLREIATEVFSGLQSLQTLDLKNNQIATFAFDNWPPAELPSLFSLWLDGNPISRDMPKAKWYMKATMEFQQRQPLDRAKQVQCEKTSKYLLNCDYSKFGDDWGHSCSGRGISCIPNFNEVTVDAEAVRIFRTELDVLDAQIFQRQFKSEHLRRIEKLDLSSNRIKFIDDAAFLGLSALSEINLSGNELWSVPTKSFRPLTALQTLNFSSNPIFLNEEPGDVNVTTGLRLDKLYLEKCRITGTHFWKIMHMCSGVRTLSLAFNLIQSIPDSAENQSESLIELLHMNNNGLTSLSFAFHPSFGHLKQLYLDENPIRLDSNSSRKLGSNNVLEFLSLRKCDIMELPKEAFTGFRNLRYLDLDSNLLKAVTPSAFSGMDQLGIVSVVQHGKLRLHLPDLKPLLELPKLMELRIGDFETAHWVSSPQSVDHFNSNSLALPPRKSLLDGIRCNCDVSLNYCIGNWVQGPRENPTWKCVVTSKWYKALEYMDRHKEDIILATILILVFGFSLLIPMAPDIIQFWNFLYY